MLRNKIGITKGRPWSFEVIGVEIRPQNIQQHEWGRIYVKLDVLFVVQMILKL